MLVNGHNPGDEHVVQIVKLFDADPADDVPELFRFRVQLEVAP